jgi:hypothetical protein
VDTLRLAVVRMDRLVVVSGALLTLATVAATARMGAALPVGALLAVLLIGCVVWGYMAMPHAAVALTIPLFAALSMLKVFFGPSIGGLKDAVAIAAAVGAAMLALGDRRRARQRHVDKWVGVTIVLFVGLYVVNVGSAFGEGTFDTAWLHGTRLTAEPLLLLLVGMTVPDARRTFRWAMASLLASACAVAAYGIVQQILGPWALADLGYSWDIHLRTISGNLRSFGTMDDAFLYSAFLLFALAAVILWMNRGLLALGLATFLSIGLLFAYVRTALLIVVALIGIWLGVLRRVAVATVLLGATIVAAFVLLFASSGTESRTVQAAPSVYLTLNGRTTAWRGALGDSSLWPFGRGVGAVGRAAERAELTIAGEGEATGRRTKAVDSGYFATVADVGFLGLGVLLALMIRLIVLAGRAAVVDSRAGRFALGVLAVLLLDSVTRSSFTGFPTAFVGLLLVGVALAAAAQDEEEIAARRRTRSRMV